MQETGVTYTLQPWRDHIGPWSTLLAHGDGLREREDAPYRRLRNVLRHPLAIRAFGMIHPDLSSRIALASSNTSRHRRDADQGRGLLAVASVELHAANGPHLVVHGHSHVPTLQAVGRGWYANAGAWYLDRQFLRIDDSRITRAVWTGSGDGELLDVGRLIAEGA